MPLDDFIIHSSDPIYWSVIATVLMKVMFEKCLSDLKLIQEKDNIRQKIQQLEKLSNNFISQAYNINQDLTISFMKEKRIGGYSIIGKVIKYNLPVVYPRNHVVLK